HPQHPVPAARGRVGVEVPTYRRAGNAVDDGRQTRRHGRPQWTRKPGNPRLGQLTWAGRRLGEDVGPMRSRTLDGFAKRPAREALTVRAEGAGCDDVA